MLDMELNEDQQKVLCETGNTFITGGAGVGKSFLINEIKNKLKKEETNYGLTAMTGTAAVLINGRTIHSFLGIGLAKGTSNDLMRKIRRNPIIHQTLIDLEVLIIDEVSMLSDILFDKLSELFSLIHKSNKPFGNLRVILVGDMSQLKPIEGDYCFKAKSWESCNFKVHILTKNMRVQDDPLFTDILSRLRWGICTDDDLDSLNELRETTFEDRIVPTKLFSKNKDVDSINNIELGKLISEVNPAKVYPIRHSTNAIKKKESKHYIDSQKIPDSLKICVGAQVIVTRNVDQEYGIVNGTRGTVLKAEDEYVLLKLTDNREYSLNYFTVKSIDLENIDFRYMPLKLGWGVSIHSSQGMTLDALEIDLGESIFTEGQAYTGLSRARSMKSIKITRLLKRSFKTNKDVIDFYNK